MRQAIQAEEIASRVAEDEHFFHKSEFRIGRKDKFVTDMIASVDGVLVFDLPEGMTTSPMVDQILAYAKDCKPITVKIHIILTMIRSTSIFTRILRCRLGVSEVWFSDFLFMSLLSLRGATVGVTGGSTSSVELGSLQPPSCPSSPSFSRSLPFSGVGLLVKGASKSAVSPKASCPSLDVGCTGNGLWKEVVLMSPRSTSSSIRLSVKCSVRDGLKGVVQNFSS